MNIYYVPGNILSFLKISKKISIRQVLLSPFYRQKNQVLEKINLYRIAELGSGKIRMRTQAACL